MRCETIKPAPFRVGGTTAQCQNDAVAVCTGKTRAEKKAAPMGLCEDCLKVFLARNPDYKNCIRRLSLQEMHP